MSQPKFTPGPWLVERRVTDGGQTHHTIGVLRDEICGVFGTHPSGRYMCVSGCIDEHDAALIAAAPDMYEALRDLYESGGPDDGGCVIQKGLAALKKARGES